MESFRIETKRFVGIPRLPETMAIRPRETRKLFYGVPIHLFFVLNDRGLSGCSIFRCFVDGNSLILDVIYTVLWNYVCYSCKAENDSSRTGINQ